MLTDPEMDYLQPTVLFRVLTLTATWVQSEHRSLAPPLHSRMAMTCYDYEHMNTIKYIYGCGSVGTHPQPISPW